MAGQTEKSSRVLRLLSSGKFDNPRDDAVLEEMIRYVIFNIALFFGAAFLILFGVSVLREGNTAQGIFDIGFGAVCALFIVLLRTRTPFIVCGLAVLAPFGLFCAYLVLGGGERGFAHLWIYAYPMLVIFVLGLYAGTILSGVVLAGIFACTLIPGFAGFTYALPIALRMIAVYLFVTALAVVYERVRVVKDRWVRRLRADLQMERDEITAMKDNLKTGIFLMDKRYVIQGAYSKALEKVLGTDEIEGRRFTSFLTASVKAKERDILEDYFGMVLNRSFDAKMLEEINPIAEFSFVGEHSGETKTLRSSFAPVDRGRGEFFILGTLEDVTEAAVLAQQLAGEEAKREEEMRALFEVIQVEPSVFNDFIEDMDYEFGRINGILKDTGLSAAEAMVEIYQSIHAIKSNAVILGLDNFSGKLHGLESEIKELREREELRFEEMLHITVELEKIMREKDRFRDTVGKIQSFKTGMGESRRQDRYVLVETLTKACEKAASAQDKRVKFTIEELDGMVLEHGPRRVIKEVLTQLVRNAVYHGIEAPEERQAQGKDSEGSIRLSIKYRDNKVSIKLADDGRGLDFDKIRAKAESLNMFKAGGPERDRNQLLQALFAPGFSTAESADVHAGRGIGLNLVKERIRDLHGSIKLQTEPGKGTVFNITIPLEDAAQKAS